MSSLSAGNGPSKWTTDILAQGPIAAAAIVNQMPVAHVTWLYRDLGFAITKIVPGTKTPAGSGWQHRSLESAEFTETDGVGLLIGALSDNLVAVDLDSERAIHLAPQLMPLTSLVAGRPGRPYSQLFYRVTDVPAEHLSTAAGGIGGPRTLHFCTAGIDMLGTGSVVVVPPSTHPSGERWFWHTFGVPPVIPFVELLEAVERLVAACGRPVDTTIPPAALWRDRLDESIYSLRCGDGEETRVGVLVLDPANDDYWRVHRDDHEWFESHPDVRLRTRPIAAAECALYGHEANTTVTVLKCETGLARRFVAPTE